MEQRLKEYFQKERMCAIDEFVNELNHHICDIKKIYRRDRWQQIVVDVRKSMYEARDLNKEKDEPLMSLAHCICFDSNGKVCKAKATQGPYCTKHSPKVNR